MTDKRKQHWLAIGWLLVMGAVIVGLLLNGPHNRLNTDIFALLPSDEQMPAAGMATRAMSSQTERKVVMLVGAAQRDSAQQAAQLVMQQLAQQESLLRPVAINSQIDQALTLYRPWRNQLLTTEQRNWLRQVSSEEISNLALMRLYQPTNNALIIDSLDDPLGLWSAWWSERAGINKVLPQDGMLWLETEGTFWIMLNYEYQGNVFSMKGDTPLTDVIEQVRTALVKQQPNSQILVSGVPFFAEAAAKQSSMEMTMISLVSLLAILLMVRMVFASFYPLMLIGLSLLSGFIFAFAVTAFVFTKIHVITLIFGASLIGVAVDYGFHYFCACQGHDYAENENLLARLLPGLCLALCSSVIAYLAFALAPFPGLKQMAVFAAAGLIGAFLTLVFWLPWFNQRPPVLTKSATWLSSSIRFWPRWRWNLVGKFCLFGLLLFWGAGLFQLRAHDDLRQLQSAPAGLVDQQLKVSKLLALPSPAQFFLVEAASQEQLLLQEEMLKTYLQPLIKQGVLQSYLAVSDWVPSEAQQKLDAQLTSRADQQALTSIAAHTGESLTQMSFSTNPLTLDQWLNMPISNVARGQYIGKVQDRYYSVVLLNGLSQGSVSHLSSLDKQLSGVYWVDRTAQYSALLSSYRVGMEWLLGLGILGMLLVLSLRFRFATWRVVAPSISGMLTVLAVFGWMNIPLQLFSVLALMLLLGIGVDYGIFLLEHQGDNKAWLAIILSGVSTILAFGLLALSSTPALHIFGLTLLLGVTMVWIFTPLFRVNSECSYA